MSASSAPHQPAEPRAWSARADESRGPPLARLKVARPATRPFVPARGEARVTHSARAALDPSQATLARRRWHPVNGRRSGAPTSDEARAVLPRRMVWALALARPSGPQRRCRTAAVPTPPLTTEPRRHWAAPPLPVPSAETTAG